MTKITDGQIEFALIQARKEGNVLFYHLEFDRDWGLVKLVASMKTGTTVEIPVNYKMEIRKKPTQEEKDESNMEIRP